MKFVAKVRSAIDLAKPGGAILLKSAIQASRAVQENHEKLADNADTIAKASKVAAGIAVAGATIAAPTGLTAAGVWLGVVSTPLIVTVAPVLVGAAGVTLTLSAAASLYSKAQKRKLMKIPGVDSPEIGGSTNGS